MSSKKRKNRRLNAAKRPVPEDIDPDPYAPDVKLSGTVKDQAKSLGAVMVGIGPSTNWPVKPGHQPNAFLPKATSVITVGLPEPQTIQLLGPTRAHNHFRKLMSSKLSDIVYQLTLWLESQGFKAYPIPSGGSVVTVDQLRKFHHEYSDLMMGDISMIHAAVFAGLAIRGKSGMAITPDYGPRARFAAVITDAPLAHDDQISYDICQDCTVCEDVCIGKAITSKGYDPVTCMMMEGVTGVPSPYHAFPICEATCLTKCPAGRGWPPKNRKPVPKVDRPYR